jgi:S1-C subfamily serine protease
MRPAALLLVVAAACHHGGGGGTTATKPLTATDIFTRSTPAIVMIESTLGSDKQFGTGFILDKQGLVATNLHVVAGAAQIKVKLKDGAQFDVVEIAGVDPNRDLAILHIAPLKPLPVLHLGDSDQMNAGDTVYAIGNPLGVFDYSVSSGLISQVRPVCDEKEDRCPPGGLKLLQISAPISQGSSGGPLFNQFGEVVGVTTLIVAQGQAINFAVPGNYLKPLVAQPIALAVDEFAAKTKASDDEHGGGTDDGPKIQRDVPDHPLTVLQGCSEQQVQDVVDAISDAIDIGAPLYNDGKIEACFRIYEGTSTKIEHDPPCPGIGKAFGDGLLRASTLASYKEKAWALRDTFDGLVDVARRRGVRPAAKKP